MSYKATSLLGLIECILDLISNTVRVVLFFFYFNNLFKKGKLNKI